MKEAHYAKLLDYELQQVFIHDIEWLAETKENVIARADRDKKNKEDYLKRDAKRKEIQAERKKFDDERKARDQAKKDAIALKKKDEEE